MDLKLQVLLLSILLSIQVALGAVLIQGLDDLLTGANGYDFIVAGGGTAGAVVAARLAENPEWKILVVEAGRSNDEVFETRVPGLWPTLAGTRVDWNYTTTPQKGINGRVTVYPRAKMLGGCSSHNSMFYNRGSADDWNRYASIIGNEDLTWKNIMPWILKSERLTDPAPSGHLDPSIHGRDGKVSVSAPFTEISFNDILIEAVNKSKGGFSFLLDVNDGRPIGTGWIQATIGNGERSSAATAYLDETGDNVHILVNIQVVRVVPVEEGGLEFRGVEIAANAQGPRRRLIANNEVIVSSGAIGTPHLLQLSGIGDRAELENFGIPTLLDNPSVGKNFSDHTLTPVAFAARTQSTDFDQQAALKQWNETRTGPLAQSLQTNQVTWVRLPASTFHGGLVDPSGGPNSPHIEMIWIGLNSDPNLEAAFASVPQASGSPNVTLQSLLVNLHPISRGSVTLASSDPFVHPLIDFGIYTKPLDLTITREAIRSARRLFSAPGLKDRLFGSISPPAKLTSDADLNAYISNVSSPMGHALGSSTMSPRGANWGVVDPDFRVKGTKGLRVIDASVIPQTPSGHPQAVVYTLAEKASNMIIGDYE